MGSDQDHHSGCLFPFGDEFLPILVFFFNINDPRNNSQTLQEDDFEDQASEDDDLKEDADGEQDDY